MEVLHTILTVIQVILAVALTVVVIGQSGKSEGLGAMAGTSDSYMSKNNGSTLDAKLAKLTKWFAILFMVLTFALNLLPQAAPAATEDIAADETVVEETVDEHAGHNHGDEVVVEEEVEEATEEVVEEAPEA